MEDRHRKILRMNRVTLVKELKPLELYDGLLSRSVFTQDMIDEIQSAGTRRDQARQLVQDLETRGKCAFPAFLECLREAGQDQLASLLQGGGTLPQPTPTPVPPVILHLPVVLPKDKYDKGDGPPRQDVPQYSDRLNPIPVLNPEKNIKNPSPLVTTRHDSLQSYKMDANPCGYCLIINNVDFDPQSNLNNRKGSNIDCCKLEKRFKSFNFIVIVKRNLKQKQIKQELLVLSKKDHSPYDCCVVVILSHGTEASNSRFPGAVYGVDGGPAVSIEFITNYLNGKHCPSLQGKPKLFFIQACGGDAKDVGFEMSPSETRPSMGDAENETDAIPMSSSSDSLSTSDETDARVTLPTPSDILVSYSTFPGYVSWRTTESGSWYVEVLDHVLEENAATVDLVNMLMMVNNKVSQNSALGIYKQMPGSFNFLRMLFYFQVLPQCQS